MRTSPGLVIWNAHSASLEFVIGEMNTIGRFGNVLMREKHDGLDEWCDHRLRRVGRGRVRALDW